jgi:hypothetical protein
MTVLCTQFDPKIQKSSHNCTIQCMNFSIQLLRPNESKGAVCVWLWLWVCVCGCVC